MNNSEYLNLIEQATNRIQSISPTHRPTYAVILGSGLGNFTDTLENPKSISYQDIPGFQGSEVHGHASKVFLGSFENKNILVFSGRMHAYEGNDNRQVTLPVRVAKAMGCASILLTNASGGIRSDFVPGDFMLITDQINFTGQNTLVGPNLEGLGERFVDMSEPFDLAYRDSFKKLCKSKNEMLHEGVYIGVSGSSYETKAEIRAFAKWGADAVGMSTVQEVIAARHAGLRILAISMITNKAAGLGQANIDHKEVLDITKKRGHVLADLIKQWLKQDKPSP